MRVMYSQLKYKYLTRSTKVIVEVRITIQTMSRV
jgi:hypothetical protein